MFTTLPDHLREKSVKDLFTMKTLSNCWPIWKKDINQILGKNITPSKIIDLGDHLSEIFSRTGDKGRGQSELSSGGAAWEALVCWYLNLCTSGSRIVAVKKMSLVPTPFRKAITVNYGNFACNTESDISIIVFPNEKNYTADKNEIEARNDSGNLIETMVKGQFNSMNILDALCEKDFDNFELGIVQCKTNWNDNAQIPMLWDMVYSAKGFEGGNIDIGKGGFSITDLRRFTYSFVTVPTNKDIYKSESVAVKRVTSLSGGNYWGKPTVQNVARSLKECFNKNYQNGFNKNIRTDLERAIPYLGQELSYFNII